MAVKTSPLSANASGQFHSNKFRLFLQNPLTQCLKLFQYHQACQTFFYALDLHLDKAAWLYYSYILFSDIRRKVYMLAASS